MLRWTIHETFDFAGGIAFGDVGAYRMHKGEAVIFVDPASIPAGAIDDLDKAPLEEGRIRLRADLQILTPADFSRGSRRLMYDFGNRGNKRALQSYNDGVATNDPRIAEHAGNGFLMRHGYSVVWVAWQGDILAGDGRMRLDVSIATDHGASIVGTVRSDFLQDAAGRIVNSMPLSGRTNTRSHPAVSLDTTRALLTRRRYPGDEPVAVPANEWMFAREEMGPGPGTPGGASAIVPSATDIYLKGGFQPGWMYQLTYQGRDPLILGLGHAAVRDVVSALKHREEDDFGNANPATGGRGRFARSHAIGVSQTGRTMRDFVYRGFNADVEGRKVFDGMLIHVSGAGRLNGARFGNYTQGGSAQLEDRVFEVDQFPFAYAPVTDPASKRVDAILRDPSTDPLVFSTHTSTEYWQRRGSLLHTDCEGRDLPQAQNARIYHFAGAQHMSFPGVMMPAIPEPAHHPENPLNVSALFRAHLVAIDAWASGAAEPPPDCVPTRAAGTLVPYEIWRETYPRIPGAMLPASPNTLTSQEESLDARTDYPLLVPLCDETGNEIGGIKPPLVAVPLATYAGWNVRKRGYGHGAMFSMFGSFLPLPRSAREAAMTGDPRAPVDARYASRDDYRAAVREAAESLVRQRHMLEEDVERIEDAAGRWWDIVLR